MQISVEESIQFPGIIMPGTPAHSTQIDSIGDSEILEWSQEFAVDGVWQTDFSGNVVATQGTMKITADKVEITRDDEGKLKMVTAYGSPTTFEQMMENGKPIHSRSATINYEPNKNLIVLTGKATVWQGESRMVGERIEYNVKTQTMRANNKTKSQGGRVSSTFIPSDFQQQKK